MPGVSGVTVVAALEPSADVAVDKAALRPESTGARAALELPEISCARASPIEGAVAEIAVTEAPANCPIQWQELHR